MAPNGRDVYHFVLILGRIQIGLDNKTTENKNNKYQNKDCNGDLRDSVCVCLWVDGWSAGRVFCVVVR